MNHETPIPNSYWVVPGKLLAGEYPRNLDHASSLAKVKALLETGVTAFVDLTEPDEPIEPYHHLLDGLGERAVSVRRFPIPDVSAPSSRQLVVQILDHIDHVMADGGIVYLHCWGGVGRTGTIVGCWLARHGYKGQAAIDRLQELWSQCTKCGHGGRWLAVGPGRP